MASLLVLLLPALLSLAFPSALAQPAAPAPAGAPRNLTAILVKGGQYTTLIRLLKETQLDQQITSQLNNSFNGLTVFAPTDNAFNNLKPGTLNALTQQQQVALVLYHILPTYYSMEMFQTASNPVRTQASGNDGVYTVNITGTTSQVNISTGIDTTSITNTLNSASPLAVYSIEKVLLPYDIFGAKPPASSPPPAGEKPGKSPAASADSPDSAAAGSGGSNAGVSLKKGFLGWSSLVGVGLMGVVVNVF
ncbi:fasciclin-like arabinogalactan protein 6 [Typha angustifolia]|uniref:fasciclin-like arabinogalactan protein 6 n=1 Tax=Typha angustifolia TaxID=59011 RepID=UPI003C2CA3FB